jgi:hypothetical protein
MLKRNISFGQIARSHVSNNLEHGLWETQALLCASNSGAVFPSSCSAQRSCRLPSPIKSPIKQSMSKTQQSNPLQKTIKKTRDFFCCLVSYQATSVPIFFLWRVLASNLTYLNVICLSVCPYYSKLFKVLIQM